MVIQRFYIPPMHCMYNTQYNNYVVVKCMHCTNMLVVVDTENLSHPAYSTPQTLFIMRKVFLMYNISHFGPWSWLRFILTELHCYCKPFVLSNRARGQIFGNISHKWACYVAKANEETLELLLFTAACERGDVDISGPQQPTS